MIIFEPTKIKLELMSNEVEEIVAELERVPHNIFKFLGYQKIIKKLKESLEKSKDSEASSLRKKK